MKCKKMQLSYLEQINLKKKMVKGSASSCSSRTECCDLYGFRKKFQVSRIRIKSFFFSGISCSIIPIKEGV